MNKIETFKLFLISNDLPLKPSLDIVKYCPELLDKYSMDELVIVTSMMVSQLDSTSKQFKIKPIVFNAAQISAMRSKMAFVDWMDKTISEAASEVLCEEILFTVNRLMFKIKNK